MKRICFLLLASLMFCSFANGSVDSNLVAHWPLDETVGTVAYDVVGGNDGILLGGITFNNNSVPGQIDNALNLDGSGNRVYAGGFSLPTNAFTTSLWFNPNLNLDSSSSRMELIHWQIIQRPHLSFNMTGDGTIRLHIRVNGQTYEDVKTTTNSWTAFRWYHIAVTFDGTDFTVYVDGNPENTVSHPGTHDPTSGAYFGSHRDKGKCSFDGILDDIRIYNRALSASEILVEVAIIEAINAKFEALDALDAALDAEDIAYDTLEQLLESGDYGDLGKADIIKAKQRIHSAIQHEEQAYMTIEKSVERLIDSLEALGIKPQPQPDNGQGAVQGGGIIAAAGGQEPILTGGSYPACWDYPAQCYGDSDGDGDVDVVDWPPFRDGFGCCYPQQCYIDNACADYNRDGCINIVDWPEFRDWFGKIPLADCPPGDINGVFQQ